MLEWQQQRLSFKDLFMLHVWYAHGQVPSDDRLNVAPDTEGAGKAAYSNSLNQSRKKKQNKDKCAQLSEERLCKMERKSETFGDTGTHRAVMILRNCPVKRESLFWTRTIAELNVRFSRKRKDSRGRNISKGGCVGITVSHVTNTPVPLANNASTDQNGYSRSCRGQLNPPKKTLVTCY